MDILSEDPGSWMNYTVPMTRAYPLTTVLRFVEQVKVVVALPWRGFSAGASLQSQSLVYEQPLAGRLSWSAAVQTKWLMPSGIFGGLAWRQGRWRFAAGVSALSEATWARPAWREWSVMPTLGIGFGRQTL